LFATGEGICLPTGRMCLPPGAAHGNSRDRPDAAGRARPTGNPPVPPFTKGGLGGFARVLASLSSRKRSALSYQRSAPERAAHGNSPTRRGFGLSPNAVHLGRQPGEIPPRPPLRKGGWGDLLQPDAAGRARPTENPTRSPLYERGVGGICLPPGGEACLRQAKRLPVRYTERQVAKAQAVSAQLSAVSPGRRGVPESCLALWELTPWDCGPCLTG